MRPYDALRGAIASGALSLLISAACVSPVLAQADVIPRPQPKAPEAAPAATEVVVP